MDGGSRDIGHVPFLNETVAFVNQLVTTSLGTELIYSGLALTHYSKLTK